MTHTLDEANVEAKASGQSVQADADGAGQEVVTTTHPTGISEDAELAGLLLPHTSEERTLLEQTLVAKGRCILTVWRGHGVLLDGHESWRISRRLGLDVEVVEVDLPDRHAARNFVINSQLGRRNATEEAKSYYRGLRYIGERQTHGGDRSTQPASGNECHTRTREALAKRYAVSPKTIQNDATFAEDLEVIAADCGREVVQAILSRDVSATRKDVHGLAAMPQDERRKVVPKALSSGRMPPMEAATRPRETMTVPIEPEALAKALMRRGPDYADRVVRALAGLAARRRAKKATQAQDNTTARGQAATAG